MAFSTKIYCNFAIEYEYAVKKIKTSQHLAKLQARKLIVSRTFNICVMLRFSCIVYEALQCEYKDDMIQSYCL